MLRDNCSRTKAIEDIFKKVWNYQKSLYLCVMKEPIIDLANVSEWIDRDAVELEGRGDNEYNVRCYDGIAIAQDDKEYIILEYPEIAKLTYEQKEEICQYNYTETYKGQEINVDDVFMLFGKEVW